MACLERATFGSPTCTACQSFFSFLILLSDIVPLRSIARPLELFVQDGQAILDERIVEQGGSKRLKDIP